MVSEEEWLAGQGNIVADELIMHQSKALQHWLNWTQGTTSDDDDDYDDDKGHQVHRKVNWCFSVGAWGN